METSEGIRLRSEGFEPAQRYVLSNVGKQTMDEIRTRITNIKTATGRQITSATMQLKHLLRLIECIVAGLLVCAVLLIVLPSGFGVGKVRKTS